MREKRQTRPKEDLSWSEVGEMAYGYLRIPLALIIVEALYWWATDPAASFEAYQTALAWMWVGLSNIIWPGSAELVFHGPSQAWTGVNLYDPAFQGGMERMYVSDECAGMHEIVFLGVLMLLTPGVNSRTRCRSILGMVLLVQLLNFVRLMVLFPIATNGSVEEMFAFHEFILSQGFLAILVLIWLAWYIILDRKGLIDRKAKPSLSDLPDLKQLRLKDSLSRLSIVVLVLSAILAVWATHEAAIDDHNMELKAAAQDCHYDTDEKLWKPEFCTDDKMMWEDVWGRAVRGWLFAGLFSTLAIVTFEPKETQEEE